VKRILFAVAMFVSIGLSGVSAAQARLDGPLRLVVPYAAGGGAIDLTARAIQRSLEKRLGVPVVIENRPGAGTKIGTQAVMNATDGRTLIIMSDPGWVGYYYTGLFDFKPWERMTPIAQISQSPYTVLTTSGRGNLDSWRKVIDKAKASGRPVAGGAPAAGGFSEMTFNELMRRAGVPGIFVPYAGAGQAKVALLAGDIDFQIESGQAFQDIRQGQTRGVAISTPERYRFAPDIPTFQELGIMDTLPTNTYSVWGPRGMDSTVVAAVAQALREVAQDPEVVQILEERNAIEVRYRDAAEVKAYIEEMDRVWGPRLAAVRPGAAAKAGK